MPQAYDNDDMYLVISTFNFFFSRGKLPLQYETSAKYLHNFPNFFSFSRSKFHQYVKKIFFVLQNSKINNSFTINKHRPSKIQEYTSSRRLVTDIWTQNFSFLWKIFAQISSQHRPLTPIKTITSIRIQFQYTTKSWRYLHP